VKQTEQRLLEKYIMKRFGSIALLLATLLLGGCVTAPRNPIALSATSLEAKAGKVGVAMTALPKLDTHLPGASCLLCIAAASAANSSLTAHTRTLPYEDLPKLKNTVAELLRKRGTDAIVIDEEINVSALADAETSGPNTPRKDFTPLRTKYKVDKLIVINIVEIGMLRTYSAYFPTSDPKGYVFGSGFMVNLSNNTFEWFQPVQVTKAAEGKWDEPPKFPGLTNAYFQALELAKDAFTKPFSN
jgi:hypothetical protein